MKNSDDANQLWKIVEPFLNNSEPNPSLQTSQSSSSSSNMMNHMVFDNHCIFQGFADSGPSSQAPMSMEPQKKFQYDELLSSSTRKSATDLVNCWSGATDIGHEISPETSRKKHEENLKRARRAEMRKIYEKKRRDKIKDRVKALHDLIPSSFKSGKPSKMVDDAIEYIKALKTLAQAQSLEFRMIAGAAAWQTTNENEKESSGFNMIRESSGPSTPFCTGHSIRPPLPLPVQPSTSAHLQQYSFSADKAEVARKQLISQASTSRAPIPKTQLDS